MDPQRKNIVILGAGFGGITALLALHRRLRRARLLREYQLILVSKSSQHLYTPALYEIASIPPGEVSALCLKSSICIQIVDILERFPAIRFRGEEIRKLDPEARHIVFASGESLDCEYAIIALGAETNFFNIPGLHEYACPLKTFEDAVRLRNRIDALIRSGRRWLNIIVGGGGATGVEISAELMHYVSRGSNRLLRGKGDVSITLVEAGLEILPGFGKDMVGRAKSRLQKLGIDLRTAAVIREVTPTEVILEDAQKISYDLLIWSGGVRATSVLKDFGLSLDTMGGVMVNEFLEACPHIYAIGDCVAFRHPTTQKFLPRNVPVAESEARHVARNIVEAIHGKPRQPFRPLPAYPYILAVGGKYALTDLVMIKFFGFLGWILKQIVELRYLLFILPIRKAFRMWLRAVYYAASND